MTEENIQSIPKNVHRTAPYTLYWEMVYFRNYSSDPKANIEFVYDLMVALHEVPNILDRWGTYDNDVEKLRLYFGCFNHRKWEGEESFHKPPDLVKMFNNKMI